MKVDYLYEAGPFGSYKNAKSSNKDSLQKLAAEGIFEKRKEEIMEVYVKDIKDLMDTMDTKFGGRIEKYRVCGRYVRDESPDTYGVGARIYLRLLSAINSSSGIPSSTLINAFAGSFTNSSLSSSSNIKIGEVTLRIAKFFIFSYLIFGTK